MTRAARLGLGWDQDVPLAHRMGPEQDHVAQAKPPLLHLKVKAAR